MPPEVRLLGSGNIDVLGLRVPVSLVVVLITFVIAWFFLQHLRTGGTSSRSAATRRRRASAASTSTACSSSSTRCAASSRASPGCSLAGRTDSGFPNAGDGDELDAISAVIIGGASFFGGRGTVLGVFAGVLVMGLLRNLLNLSNVQVFWQQVLIGVIIIAVVAFDVFRRRLASAG